MSFLLAISVSLAIVLACVWLFPPPAHFVFATSESLYEKLIWLACFLVVCGIVIAIQIARFNKWRGNENKEKQKWDSEYRNARAYATANLKPIVDEQRAYHEARNREHGRRYFGETISFVVLIIAAAIAFMQWLTLEKTDRTLHDTVVTANRAWVYAIHSVFRDQSVIGVSPQIVYELRNAGREPAIHGKLSTAGDVVDWPENGDFLSTPAVGDDACKMNWKSITTPPVWPGNASDPPSLSTSLAVKTKDGVPLLWNKAMEERKSVLRVRGCFTYETFRRLHETWFCFVFVPILLTTTQTGPRMIGAGCNGGDGAN